MVRVKGAVITRKKHKKIMKLAKGYFQGNRKRFRAAKEAVVKALSKRRAHLREKKRNMRRLWIVRINAAVREFGLSYSKFISGLKKANVAVNRKMLAEMAISDPKGFEYLVETAKKALEA